MMLILETSQVYMVACCNYCSLEAPTPPSPNPTLFPGTDPDSLGEHSSTIRMMELRAHCAMQNWGRFQDPYTYHRWDRDEPDTKTVAKMVHWFWPLTHERPRNQPNPFSRADAWKPARRTNAQHLCVFQRLKIHSLKDFTCLQNNLYVSKVHTIS